MLSLPHFMDEKLRLRMAKQLVLFPHLQNVPRLQNAECKGALTLVMREAGVAVYIKGINKALGR